MTTRRGKEWRKITDTDINDEETHQSRSCSPVHEDSEENETEKASLDSILRELKDFRRDNKKQLSDIQENLQKTNERLETAECRIDEVEISMQAASTLLKRMVQRQNDIEAKLTDQEARARRDNVRIYNIPEQAENNNMIPFLEKMLRESLDFPREAEVKIERAHRALGPKPADPSKPRSIIAKFASFTVKEEVIRRAWQKKQVFYNNKRYYVDHDYPPAILKKRAEYSQAKKVLKEKKVKFQTPYPAKMRVFFEEGTRLYQNAAEATADMSSRGFPVTVISPHVDPFQHELQRLSSWQMIGDQDAAEPRGRPSQTSEDPRRRMVEKLQEFRRQATTD